MTQKVSATYTVDDTTTDITVVGDRVSTQLWDSGRAQITVRDDDGRRTRVVHLARAWIIDVEYQ